jgi:hypothetical protein
MSYQPSPVGILGQFIMGVYDSDDSGGSLVVQTANAGGRCVKILSDGGLHARRAAQLGLLTIGRNQARLEEPMSGIDPSAQAAVHWVNDIFLPWVKPYGEIMKKVYWEDAYNELGSLEDPATLKGFNDFEVTRQTLMGQLGYRCCIGNFSAEARLYDKVGPFVPALRLAAQLGNLVGLHAYWSPDPDNISGRVFDWDTGAVDPRVEEFIFPEEWLARALRAMGEPVPFCANTEFGIDELLSLGWHSAGWRTTPISGDDYVRQEVAICQRKRARGICKGAFTFCDDTDPSGAWVQYNTHGARKGDDLPVTLMILNQQHDHPDGPIAVPAQPGGPVEVPPPVEPPPATGFPAWYRVSTGGSRLRKRLAPSLQGEIVEKQADESEILVESIDADNWAKEKGAGLYASADYLVRK